MVNGRQERKYQETCTREDAEKALAAGLEDFTFHDCRHHFASWFMMRGGDLLALSRLLGHRDIKMTLRYAHLAREHLRSQMERTSKFSTTSAHGGKIEAGSPVSPREAGVAQRQSN